MLWQAVFDALAPVFLAILVGAGLCRLRFLPEGFFGGLNQLAFWVCLPCLLFTEIARCHVPGRAVLGVSSAIALALAPTLLVAWLAMRLVRVPPSSRSAFLQGSVRGNLAYVGIGPLIGLALVAPFGLTGDLRTMTLLYLACPTAVASYVMADQMGADKDLAGAIVVLSTLYAFPVMAAVLVLAR